MAVYVDELFEVEKTTKWRWGKACHLTADTIEELHNFALMLGMRRSWFQDHPRHPHYDLTEGRRKAAVKLGAIEINARAQAEKRINEDQKIVDKMDDDRLMRMGISNEIPGISYAFSLSKAIDQVKK